jgi:anti-anti-sigma factor
MNDSPSLSLRQALELPVIALPTFSVVHELGDKQLVVRLSGNADSEVAQALAHYLERLHEEVARAKLREVVLDFRELYFLTSSCIKCLVVAIKRVMAMDARAQYKIRLLTTPTLRWQERSFEVLCQIAPLLVTMTPD